LSRFQEVVAPPQAVFAAYLDLWSERQGWMVRDKLAAARVFAGLLKAGIFEQALFENAIFGAPCVQPGKRIGNRIGTSCERPPVLMRLISFPGRAVIQQIPRPLNDD
jgi:hypothetical protein